MKAEIVIEVGKVYVVNITDPAAPAELSKKLVILMDNNCAINIDYLRNKNKCTVSIASEIENEYILYCYETLGKNIADYDGIESYLEYKNNAIPGSELNTNYLYN